MKKLLSIFLLISVCAKAQFGPSTNSYFDVATEAPASSFLILNTPGVGNYNLSATNALELLNASAVNPISVSPATVAAIMLTNRAGSLITGATNAAGSTMATRADATNAVTALTPSIMATNSSQFDFQNGLPTFPDGVWSEKWEIVQELTRTNGAADGKTFRVPTCYYDGDMIRVYYAGYTNDWQAGGNTRGSICALFGRSWDSLTKYGIVMSPSASGWDSANLGGARVYRFDDSPTNYLYYFASSNSAFESGWQAVGVATTTDGTNFTKYSGNPILYPTETWESRSIQGAVHVFKYNGVFYMFYGAKTSNGAQPEFVGMATATNPFGPWTKYAGNPVLTNAAGIVAEPNVFKLNDNRGWGMITGQGSATSTNLTNWVYKTEFAYSESPLFTNLVSSGFFLSPFVFSDNGMAALFDTTYQIVLARPKRIQPAMAYSGEFSGTGKKLNLVSATALKPYYGTNSLSIGIDGTSTATGEWFWNSSQNRYTNSTTQGAIIIDYTGAIVGFQNVMVFTNSAHPTAAGFADVAGYGDVGEGLDSGVVWNDETLTPAGLAYFGGKTPDGYRLQNTVTNSQTTVTFGTVVGSHVGNGISLTNIPATALAKINTATNAPAWFDSTGTLRSTNSTGSGSVVLSNAPTIENLFVPTNASIAGVGITNSTDPIIRPAGTKNLLIDGGTSAYAQIRPAAGSAGKFTFLSSDFYGLNGTETLGANTAWLRISAKGITIKSNALSGWPTAPATSGDSFIGNSNGVLYVLYSTNGSGGGSATWTKTNYFGP